MDTFEAAVNAMTQCPELEEKLLVDSEPKCAVAKPKSSEKIRPNAWNRKRQHKKKMVRRFLTMNPAMNYADSNGMNCRSGIYVQRPHVVGEKNQNHRRQYTFNPYTKVYLSKRGDIRVYRGKAAWERGIFCLANKDKRIQRVTNRRIRRAAMEDGASASFSYYKKSCNAGDDGMW